MSLGTLRRGRAEPFAVGIEHLADIPIVVHRLNCRGAEQFELLV